MTGSDAVEVEDLSADPRVAGRLARYVDLLLEANRGLNLTAARTRAAVIAHVADSLAIAPFVRGPLIDIGSGGGFPAIPLAIALDIEVTLVESVVKKARFLEGVVRALGLAAAVRVGRAEDVGARPGATRAVFDGDGARGFELAHRARAERAVSCVPGGSPCCSAAGSRRRSGAPASTRR